MNNNNIITLTKNDKGIYSCQIPVSIEQWLDLLNEPNIISPEWKKVLFSFYFMPQHKATCTL